jgi:hypothetical protein
MSLEQVPGTSLSYHLLAFDAAGRERSDADGPRSRAALDAMTTEPITDVFLFSHGWQEDIPTGAAVLNDEGPGATLGRGGRSYGPAGVAGGRQGRSREGWIN